MELSYAEMFLIVWSSAMTLLYVMAKNDARNFRQFTVYKLRQVVTGKAKIVDDGESISIVDINQEIHYAKQTRVTNQKGAHRLDETS